MIIWIISREKPIIVRLYTFSEVRLGDKPDDENESDSDHLYDFPSPTRDKQSNHICVAVSAA